ncbi:MAG: hypothetical protein ABIB43_04220 [archaeon]
MGATQKTIETAVKKVLGPAATTVLRGTNVILWGVSAISTIKAFKTFMEKDPVRKQIKPLEEEIMKWGMAISYIGREPYRLNDMCSIERGGAINELGIKQYLHISETRYPWQNNEFNKQYHVDPANQAYLESPVEGLKYPDLKKAKGMILAAIGEIQPAANYLQHENFHENKCSIINRLKEIEETIPIKYMPGQNYSTTQKALSNIVREMCGLEMDYKFAVSKLELDLNKKRLKYGIMAGVAGLIGKLSGSKTP